MLRWATIKTMDTARNIPLMTKRTSTEERIKLGWSRLLAFFKNSLGAHDGFTQPIRYKRFDRFILLISQNALKKQWSGVTSLRESLLGLNWKSPFSPYTYPITYKVGFLYFRSLCIRDTVSNKTYQNFCDKKLVWPWSKYPIWQRCQPISYKAKFWQRDIIYLVDFKYNITYQNI